MGIWKVEERPLADWPRFKVSRASEKDARRIKCRFRRFRGRLLGFKKTPLGYLEGIVVAKDKDEAESLVNVYFGGGV